MVLYTVGKGNNIYENQLLSGSHAENRVWDNFIVIQLRICYNFFINVLIQNNKGRKIPSSLLTVQPMCRLSGVFPLHRSAHKKNNSNTALLERYNRKVKLNYGKNIVCDRFRRNFAK